MIRPFARPRRAPCAALAGALALLAAAPAPATDVGVAAVDLTPLPGVPLAGYFDRRRCLPDLLGQDPYAHYFEVSTGTRLVPGASQPDAIRAKALVLRDGARRLVFLSLDVVALPRGLRDALLARLAADGLLAPGDEILMSATHTHSGPGALSDVWLFEKTASDRFHADVFDDVAAGVAAAVGQASLAAAPATLHAVAFEAPPDLQVSRCHCAAPVVDRTANVLLVRSGTPPRWSGALVNVAVHGTALGPEGRELSADVPGAIERAVGELLAAENGTPGASVPVLFVNGAEGDVSPGDKTPEALGASFASELAAKLPALRTVTASWTVEREVVSLGAPLYYYEKNVPAFLRPLLLRHAGLWLPWLPRDAPIASIQLGDMRLMTWPGEPTSALGIALHAEAAARGAAQTWVLGLTDDHLLYFATPDEFAERDDTAVANSVYGPHAGERLLNAHCRLLQ